MISSEMNSIQQKVEMLLSPISPLTDVGENVRETPAQVHSTINESTGYDHFNALKRAAKAARGNERQIPDDFVGKRVEYNLIKHDAWFEIEQSAELILKHYSKDLEVVSYLIEAWTRLYGFEGLAGGFLLAQKLVETYQHTLFPLLDQSDFDPKIERISHLIGLNGKGKPGTLIKIIHLIPLLQSESGLSISTYICNEAKLLKTEADIERFGLSLKDIATTFSEKQSAFLLNIQTSIINSIQSYEQYLNTMEIYVGKPIDGGYIFNALNECLAQFNALAQEFMVHTESEEMSLEDSTESEAVIQKPVRKKNMIENRKDAINQLRKISKYFRETEPHSPISYGIDRVVRWSELSLIDLMKELVPDQKSQEKLTDLSGLDLKS